MFQRFWVCGGVYGNRDSLRWLRQAVSTRRPDAVLFAGGILAPSRQHVTRSTFWSLTLEDCRFIEEFFSTLGNLGVYSALIHGLGCEPLEEFVQLGMQAELAFPTVHLAHATLLEVDGLAICGVGGVVAEKDMLGIDSSTRSLAEYALRPLWTAKQSRKVLLLASPPPGPLGGSEGVPLIGELIDSFHPDLCVVHGSSQRRGSERVGHTLVINPGCLADGWAAWLDWGRPAQGQVEFVNLSQRASSEHPRSDAPGIGAGSAAAHQGLARVEGREKCVLPSDIRVRAYQLWEAAGRPPGNGVHFWFEAEKELGQKMVCGSELPG